MKVTQFNSQENYCKLIINNFNIVMQPIFITNSFLSYLKIILFFFH